MGQGAAKAKQGGEEVAPKETEKKDDKKAPKTSDKDELIAFMMKHYDSKVKDLEKFDDFYHVIYELIEKFCEERGQLQYRIPTRDDLEKQYNEARKSGPRTGQLTLKQFEKFAEGIVKVDSFTVGHAAFQILGFLFGLPVGALLTKRIVPGLKAISDDIVISAATSFAVVYLAKANKL